MFYVEQGDRLCRPTHGGCSIIGQSVGLQLIDPFMIHHLVSVHHSSALCACAIPLTHLHAHARTYTHRHTHSLSLCSYLAYSHVYSHRYVCLQRIWKIVDSPVKSAGLSGQIKNSNNTVQWCVYECVWVLPAKLLQDNQFFISKSQHITNGWREKIPEVSFKWWDQGPDTHTHTPTPPSAPHTGAFSTGY